MRDTLKTLICYYHGIDGPTIRIDVKTREWLVYFKKCILSLAEEEIQAININCLDNVVIDNLKSITLVKVRRKKFSSVSLVNNCFTWSQDTEEFVTLMGLIDGLLEGIGSGHQYLDSDGDNVSIILALNELGHQKC